MSNNNKEDKYNLDNTYNKFESYIYEKCTSCGKDMTDIKDIFIDKETDNYVCKDCKNKYSLKVIKCKELQ